MSTHVRFPLRGNGNGRIERYADAVETLVRSQHRECPSSFIVTPARSGRVPASPFTGYWFAGTCPKAFTQELGRYGWDPGSDQVLLDYVNSHMRDMAELLVHRHVLDRVPDEMPRLHP